MSPEQTSATLLEKIRNPQDSGAWCRFDHIYRPMLMRIARRMGLREEDSQDAVQECFKTLQSRIRTFQYEPAIGKFRGFIRQVLLTRIYNLRRKPLPVQPLDGLIEEAPGREPSPEEVFAESWLQEHIRHCLRLVREEVSPRTYQAFLLAAVDQQPLERVSVETGMKIGAVRVAVHRVKRRLKRHLAELIGDWRAEPGACRRRDSPAANGDARRPPGPARGSPVEVRR
jgi:RNA polymerase sigma-70 factor (ECF subfamily)